MVACASFPILLHTTLCTTTVFWFECIPQSLWRQDARHDSEQLYKGWHEPQTRVNWFIDYGLHLKNKIMHSSWTLLFQTVVWFYSQWWTWQFDRQPSPLPLRRVRFKFSIQLVPIWHTCDSSNFSLLRDMSVAPTPSHASVRRLLYLVVTY